MRKCKNEIFYHMYIKSDKNWNAGDKFTVGKEINPYSKGWQDREYKTKDLYINDYAKYLLHNLSKEYEDKDSAFKGLAHLNQELLIALLSNLEVARETVFENVRKEHFPDYPSRLTCLYVNDYENLKYYWDNHKFGKEQNRDILKLKLTGKIHKAYSASLDLKTFSYNQFRQLAFEYWEGKPAETVIELLKGTHNIKAEKLTEHIFEGKVEVIEKVDPKKLKLKW